MRPFSECFPNCMHDKDVTEALFLIADRVAANCSATNGQVLEIMGVVLSAIVDTSTRRDALVPKIADAIDRGLGGIVE